jgi:hypothetical protein
MVTNLYNEYANLEIQAVAIEVKKDQLRPLILKQMLDNDIDKKETAIGKFSITRLKKWTYPEKVLKIGEDFKAAKAKSESTGEADYVEQPSLRFNMIKI